MCTQSQKTARSYLARAYAGETFNLQVFELKHENSDPEIRVTDLDLTKGHSNEVIIENSFLFDDLFNEHDCQDYYRNVEIDHRHTITIKKAQEHAA
tara:strand:- start:302 stop:589 length:288 start_codon:yes stop_codon:yes gene_type:complete